MALAVKRSAHPLMFLAPRLDTADSLGSSYNAEFEESLEAAREALREVDESETLEESSDTALLLAHSLLIRAACTASEQHD